MSAMTKLRGELAEWLDQSDFWLGADPGGKNAFGLAFLKTTGEFRTALVSCAEEAVLLLPAQPLGIGIDAPLWWSSGISSDRKADQWIRTTYKIQAGTVQTANSLRGAALVQGAMYAKRLRDRFPDAPVTEAHPKALAIAMGGWQSAALSDLGMPNLEAEHERDALLSAIAAREGFSGRWSRDLSIDRHAEELDPSCHWIGPVHYFWP